MRDLHTSLRSEILSSPSTKGANIVVARLQDGKEDVRFSLHVAPNEWTTAGLQPTDTLSYLGFDRSDCPFHPGRQCYAREIGDGFDSAGFANSLPQIHRKLADANQHLEECGLPLDIREGWGFFYGKASQTRSAPRSSGHGDGHRGATTRQLKAFEDDVFRYVLSWTETTHSKGWTSHFIPRHPPVTPETSASLQFIGLLDHPTCPEADFEPCWWRHLASEGDTFSAFRDADGAHRSFAALQTRFSPAIRALIEANTLGVPFAMQLLNLSSPTRARSATGDAAAAAGSKQIQARPAASTAAATGRSAGSHEFDVALSFAGADRKIAEAIAVRLRDAGFRVFYDDFYPEHLWGKDLPAFFHEVYNTRARYCMILVSPEYAQGMWTNHERRSAQERMLRERGSDYILPVQVREAEVPGLQGTIGFLPLDKYGPLGVAELLIKRLTSA